MKKVHSRRTRSAIAAAGGLAGCVLGLVGATPAAAADPSSDLAVALDGPSEWMLNGGPVPYHVTVTNNGPDSAATWTVRIPFGGPKGPDGVNPSVSQVSTSDPRCTTAPTSPPKYGTDLVCSGGPLAAGSSETIDVSVSWILGITGFGLGATVEGQGADPTPGNNSARAGTTLLFPPPVDVPMIDPVVGTGAAAVLAAGGAVGFARRRVRGAGQRN
ncbi:hypothetical protein ABZ922_43885 [Streptomyces shenzhenensis]|uniref:hypothetical protein n=1 Tax=Streptomyces shenzhenensis TaxID=943815 RepID=UPI0033CAC1EC